MKSKISNFTPISSVSVFVLVYSINIFGKALGFIRLQQLAANLGVSIETDVVMLVLQVLSLWDVVFLTGGAVALYLPKLTEYFISGREHRFDFISARLINFMLVASIIFSGIIIALVKYFPRIIAPGFNKSAQELLWSSVLLLGLYPACITVMNLVATMHRACNRFVLYSFNPIIINMVGIVCLKLVNASMVDRINGAKVYLISIVVSTGIMAIVNIRMLPKKSQKMFWGMLCRAVYSFRKTLKSMLNMAKSSTSAIQIMGFTLVQSAISTIIYSAASKSGDGAISAFGYSDRLGMMAYSVIIGSAFVVMEQGWSSVKSRDGSVSMLTEVKNDMFKLSMLYLPFIWVVFFSSSDLIRVAYFGIATNSPDLIKSIGNMARNSCIGFYAMYLYYGLSRAVIIDGRLKYLLTPCILSLGASYPICSYLSKIYGSDGISSSFSCIMLIQLVALWIRLSFDFSWRSCVLNIIKKSVLALVSTSFGAIAGVMLPLTGVGKMLSIWFGAMVCSVLILKLANIKLYNEKW